MEMCVCLTVQCAIYIIQTTERVRAETRAEENKAVKKHYEAIVAQLTKEKEEAQAALTATLQRVSHHCFRGQRLDPSILPTD